MEEPYNEAGEAAGEEDTHSVIESEEEEYFATEEELPYDQVDLPPEESAEDPIPEENEFYKYPPKSTPRIHDEGNTITSHLILAMKELNNIHSEQRDALWTLFDLYTKAMDSIVESLNEQIEELEVTTLNDKKELEIATQTLKQITTLIIAAIANSQNS